MARILVVDNEPGCRAPLLALLEQEGHDAVGATNGLEALSACLRATPDLIVLDLDLPEMNGVTFLRVLRSSGRWSDTPVILVTHLPSSLDVDRAAELGILAHFEKGSMHLASFVNCIRQRLNVASLRTHDGKRATRRRHRNRLWQMTGRD